MRPFTRYLLPLLLIVLAVATDLRAQDVPKTKNFPVAYGPTNAGREFWLAFPANWDVPAAPSYYIRLYITSAVRTQVKVWAGPAIKRVFYTVPNDIVMVDLNPIEAQMFTRTDQQPIPIDQMYAKKAVHILAEAPIIVYGMNRTTNTSDGVLALPVNVLGRNYVVSSYAAVTGGFQELPSQYMIVAPYDGTTVTINHPHRTPNHAAGETFTINMNKGDVWSAMTVGFGGDMSGVTIKATKPVGVIGGQNCTYIPNLLTFCCCDHLSEMMLPTESWGKIYQGVPFLTRLKGDFFRIFAKEPNTTIFVNGIEYATLNGVGGMEGEGWFEYRALDKNVVEFSADKPINVSQYNTSQAYDNVPSDPFYLVLTPLEQFATGVFFCTPHADYPKNFVNVVSDEESYPTIELALAGSNDWQRLSTLSGVSPAKFFPTRVNGKRYVGVALEIRPGVYRMRSKGHFAAYLYGFSSFDSYGYPLSVVAGDLTKADKDAPLIVKKQTCDGTVEVTTTDMPVDDAIRTNISTIELDPDPANTDNYELIVTPFEAGVSVSTTYTLKVLDRSKAARAVMIISDMAGNVTLDTIYYNPLTVTLTPTPQDYGKLRVGSIIVRTVTITNESDNSVQLTEILLKSKVEGFRIISPTSSVVLGPKGSPTASVEVQIEYTAAALRPGSLQMYEDSVGVRDNCGLRYLALVKAQVVKPMIRVTDNDFGANPLNTRTSPWSMEVRNTSPYEGSTLTVNAKTGPDQPMIFDVVSGDALSLPFTLEPNETKSLNIVFTAPSVTTFNDAVRFISDAMDASEDDSTGFLTGQGIVGVLFATNNAWPRLRMGDGKDYSYIEGTDNDGVQVRNIGTAGVRVTGAHFDQTDPSAPDYASFSYNLSQIQGLPVTPGGSLDMDVTFSPRRTGQHRAKIIYEVDPPQAEPVFSILTGYGTTPMLNTTDYSFGPMMVDNNPANTIAYNDGKVDPDRIAFWVPNLEEIDSVTIIGFEFNSTDVLGVPDFTHNLPNPTMPLATPIVLKPGEVTRFVIDGVFKARAGGSRTASVRAITQDGVDTTSRWNGLGTVENSAINLTATTLEPLCVDATGVITVIITNVGESNLNITNMAMDGGPFVIVVPADPTAAFVIPAGESREVMIQYTAQKGTQTANLVVTSDAVNTQSGVSFQEISGKGQDENWNTKLVLKAPNGGAELGKEITAEISLDETFPGEIPMNTYTVTLEYDANLLVPRLPAVTGKGSSDNSSVRVIASQPGKLVLEVTGAMVSNTDPLLRVPFAVLFSTELTRNMGVTSVTTDASCLVVNGSNATINVNPICGLNLRMIELTAAPYTLNQNKPNPFNPVTKIRYSLGLDAPTTVQLFDAQGRMVQMLVNEHQQPGTYELTLDVTNLPSGNYYYTLVSGDYKETKMLTVTK